MCVCGGEVLPEEPAAELEEEGAGAWLGEAETGEVGERGKEKVEAAKAPVLVLVLLGVEDTELRGGEGRRQTDRHRVEVSEREETIPHSR